MATRIPRKIAAFNDYIVNSDNYLQLPSPPPAGTNGVRLGLTADNVTRWHDYRQHWDTVYARYTNVNTKTKVVVAELNEMKDAFITFAQPLLDIVASSPNAVTQDAETLNFKIGRSEPSRPTTPIGEMCQVEVATQGQGVIKFTCRTAEEKRPAMAPGANLIEIRYRISEEPPVGYDDNCELGVLGKAVSRFDFGSAHVGKRAWVYFRYYNSKYPHLAGVYSRAVSFIIS